MKFKTRWFPQNSRPFTSDYPHVEIHVYEHQRCTDGQTRYLAIGYSGKRNNQDFHYTFKTAKIRADYLRNYITERKQADAFRAETLANRKADRAKPHTLQVGDVLKNSWGYDQTNIDYYEVTRVIGPHTVEICEIGQSRRETGFMQGHCTPICGKFIGQPMIKRADKDNSIKIHDWGSWAHKVSPVDTGHWTAYA